MYLRFVGRMVGRVGFEPTAKSLKGSAGRQKPQKVDLDAVIGRHPSSMAKSARAPWPSSADLCKNGSVIRLAVVLRKFLNWAPV
jgi:hypothetical protein